jgi:hypothetical protein
LSIGPDDRQPLTQRELAWIAIELTAAVAAWFIATSLLAENVLHAQGAWADVMRYGGGLGVALFVGWWRIIRFGPQGPPRSRQRQSWSRSELDADGAGLLISAGLATAMAVGLLLQASEDQRALTWGVVFAGMALVQFTRFFLRRRRGK